MSINALSTQLSLLSLASPAATDPQVSAQWLELIKSPYFTHVTGDIEDRLGHMGLTLNRRGKGMYLITYGDQPFSAKIIHKSLQTDINTEIAVQLSKDGFQCETYSIAAQNVEELVEQLRPHLGICMSSKRRSGLDQALVTLFKMKDTRIQRLLNRTIPLVTVKCEKSIIKRDCAFLETVIAQGYTTTAGYGHSEKNRYTNVLPYDETLVCIADKPDFYINASHVAMSHQNYVLTQAPTAQTLSDFWLAVIHTGSTLVVSLDSREKYWDVESAIVRLVNTEQISDNITRRTYNTNAEMTITHLECRGWPDHAECPMELFTHILDAIDAYKPAASVPIWVHCLAGRGRSGTAVVGHNSRLMVRQAMSTGGSAETIYCNVRKEVAVARMQREGVVEKSQLPMLYNVLIQEREKMLCPIT